MRRHPPLGWFAVGCAALWCGGAAATDGGAFVRNVHGDLQIDTPDIQHFCEEWWTARCCAGKCCDAPGCGEICNHTTFHSTALVEQHLLNTTTAAGLCEWVDGLRRSRLIYLLGGVFSLTCCVVTLALYAKAHPVQRLPPADLLRNRVIMDAFVSIGFMLPSFFDTYGSIVCETQAIVIQFFSVFSLCWWISFSWELMWSVRDPFASHYAHLRYYHFWGWCVSLVITGSLVISDNIGLTEYDFCWIKESNHWLSPIISFGPVAVGLLTSLFVVLWMCTTSDVAIPESHKIRKIAISQSLWTICLIGLYWIFSATVFLGGFSATSVGSVRTVTLMCMCQAFRGVVSLCVWLKTAQLAKEGHMAGTQPPVQMDTEMNASFLTPGMSGRTFETRLPVGECKESIPLKWALRRDVVHACQQGVVAMAKRAWQQCAGNDVPELDVCHFEETIQEQFRREDSEGATFTFIDTAPMCFYAIRRLMGISTTTYRKVFEYEEPDDTLMEKFTDSGSSGSFFYFTAGKEFIVKTVTEDEARLLVQLLPSLYQHLVKHPDSLICRIYGLHGIKMHRGAKTLHLVVMDNIFLTKRSIDEVYDIKGSWVDRGPVRQDQEEDDAYEMARSGSFLVRLNNRRPSVARRREAKRRRPRQNRVMKDLDMLERMEKMRKCIVLEDDVRKALLEQLAADAAFFASHGIMDYSLLVGIHRGPYRELRKPRRDLCIDPTSPIDAVESPVRMRKCTKLRSSPSGGYRPPLACSPSAGSVSGSPDLLAAGPPAEAGAIDEAPDVTPEGPIAHQTSLFRKDEGGMFCGVRSIAEHSGDNMYFVGVIDVLQVWNCRKNFENIAKIAFRGSDPNGISAVNPDFYAQRFMKRCKEIIFDSSTTNPLLSPRHTSEGPLAASQYDYNTFKDSSPSSYPVSSDGHDSTRGTLHDVGEPLV
eukprot:TRINITY_DN5043_c0_g1_i2.p1 TRINITY_DN5043_c0_g1~~TRINITY_DN5043_c0_g1_i2.p1  ORF type:complete len:930 (+),score=174.56 TRINITY_DN5043_c0_g1_i2:107-2896(+)